MNKGQLINSTQYSTVTTHHTSPTGQLVQVNKLKQLSAKLVIVTPNTIYTLVAFLPIIKQIANDDTITSATDKQIITTKILMADPFQLSYTPNKIISNVSRN